MLAEAGRKEGRKREQRGGKDGEGSGAAPREGDRGREGGNGEVERERGGEVRTSQIARKDAWLSASARSRTAFLALVLALRPLPSSGPHFANERPTDRRPTDGRPTALGIRQRSTSGRRRRRGGKRDGGREGRA